MNDMQKQKHSLKGIEILRALANKGRHIFTLKEAQEAAHQIGISSTYVVEALSHLKHQGWIQGLKRGLYAFTQESGMSESPHEWEIAQALVPQSVISYWTAMRHYQMTEQLPHITFSMVPKDASIPRNVSDQRFCFVKAKQEHFFGISIEWINQAKIQITDPERTLLEGLRHPEYCGGFREVLAAFKASIDKLDMNKLTAYACRLEVVIPKRLGWILENLRTDITILDRLEQLPMKGHRKIDPSAPPKGKYNAKWQLQENI